MDDQTRQILALPQVRRVLELVGLTAILWNEVEALWYLIYTCLLHEAPRRKVDKLYKHFTTGAAKREFLMGLADEAFVDHPDLRATIGALNARTNDVSALRNSIVHADYRFDVLNGPPGLRISPSGGHNRRPNILAQAGHKLEQEIQSTIDQLDALIDELDEFRIYLIQSYLPEGKRTPPPSEAALASMPPELRRVLPREFRERVSLRTPPAKSSKAPRPKR